MDFTFHFMDRVSFLTGFWRFGESMDELNRKLLLPQPANCCPCFSERDEKRHLLSPFGVFSVPGNSVTRRKINFCVSRVTAFFCVSDLPDLLLASDLPDHPLHAAWRVPNSWPQGNSCAATRRRSGHRAPAARGGWSLHPLPRPTSSRGWRVQRAQAAGPRSRRHVAARCSWSARRARRSADGRGGRRRSRSRARGADPWAIYMGQGQGFFTQQEVLPVLTCPPPYCLPQKCRFSFRGVTVCMFILIVVVYYCRPGRLPHQQGTKLGEAGLPSVEFGLWSSFDSERP